MKYKHLTTILILLASWPLVSFSASVERQFVPLSVIAVPAALEDRQQQAMLFESYPDTANVYVRVAKGGSWGSKWYAVAVKSTKEAVLARFPAGQYINVQLAPGDWDMGVFYKQKKVKENLFKTQPISSRFDLNLKAGAVVFIDCYEPGDFPDADRDTDPVLQSAAMCQEGELSAFAGGSACVKPYDEQSNKMSRSKLIKAKKPISSCKLISDKAVFQQSTLAETTPYLTNQDYTYHQAKALNTVEAYQFYIDSYPNGVDVGQSRKKIQDIKQKTENNAYEKAQQLNTMIAFETFLQAFPQSSHANAAKEKIKELKLSEAVSALLQRYQRLPLQVKKDKMMITLTNHLKQKQYSESFLYFEALHRLKVQLSPSFAYFWGEALVKTEQYKKGLDKLYAYITQAGSAGQYYSMALTLSNEAEEGLRVVQKRLEEQRLLKVEQDRRWSELKAELENELDLVAIPPGSFLMGREKYMLTSAKPVRFIHMKAFKMGRYEVTQKLWKKFMGSNPSKYEVGDRFPVNNVSWHDVQKFIRTVNKRTGQRFRLPSEVEWEYAGRAGTTTDYSWGNNLARKYAWFKENSGRDSHQVGEKEPNRFGLYDMFGNVEEWVQDCKNHRYDGAASDASAWLDGDCSYAMQRGGDYTMESDSEGLMSAYRSYSEKVNRYGFLGFRLAHD